MKRVKYIIDQQTDTNKKQLFEYVLKTFGDKATFQNNTIEVEKHDESKILDFFKRSGYTYKKAA